MKALVLLVVAGLACGLDRPPASEAGDASLAVQATPAGRIDFERRFHDFGARFEGEILSTSFLLRNAGDGPLVITQIKPAGNTLVGRVRIPDASGTASTYELGDPIPAGQELAFEVRFNTRDKRGLARGEVRLYSNDPQGVTSVAVQATLSALLSVEPARLDLGAVAGSRTSSGEVIVASRPPRPFRLEPEDRQLPAGLTVTIEPIEPDPKGRALRWRVGVSVSSAAREGRISYTLNLHSDQVVEGTPNRPDGTPTVHSAMVSINALAKEPVTYEPRFLSFGLVRPGSATTRRLRIETEDDVFSLQDVSVRLKDLTDSAGQARATEKFHWVVEQPEDDVIEVELRPELDSSHSGPFRGKLVVQTGLSARPEIEVWFGGYVRN